MESAYRAWLKSRKEGLISHHLDKLTRELQMALGTAKWQLEEFERAVCLSYRNNGDDITMTRHKEFVSAIEDQISRVETALKESLEIEGKKPFRWVNLDKEESDDLAHFLSGTPGTSHTIKDSRVQVREAEDEISYRADQSLSDPRAWSLPDGPALEIVVDTDDRETDELIEATPKEKGSKPLIWRSRGEMYRRAKEVKSHTQMILINWINNNLRGRQRNQRQHVSPVLPAKSISFVLALMLTIFLFVPFVLYST